MTAKLIMFSLNLFKKINCQSGNLIMEFKLFIPVPLKKVLTILEVRLLIREILGTIRRRYVDQNQPNNSPSNIFCIFTLYFKIFFKFSKPIISTGELGYDRLNGTRKIGPSYAKSIIYI